MLKFRIGEYYEMYQGLETTHREQTVECASIDEAQIMATASFGWGAWAVLESDLAKAEQSESDMRAAEMIDAQEDAGQEES